MTDGVFVYILFFASAALSVLGLYQYYAKDKATAKKINRRMALIGTVPDHAEVLQILREERGLGRGLALQRFKSLTDLIVQSGVRLQDPRVVLSVGLASCVLTAGLVVMLGFQIYTLPLGLALTVGCLHVWLTIARNRRIARFGEQLPDVLDVIVRSLKAGHPLPVAISLVGREMPDPAGTEFGIASDEVAFGLALPTAIEGVTKRVGARDLLFVQTSISIQSQLGGNLGEVLGRLSKLIRERFRVRRKVTALTSEGRLTAIFLTALPISLFLFINLMSPHYYGDIWNEPSFRKAMAVAMVLLVIGNIIIRRMINFKY
jgi:tight adherence protein B